MMGLILLSTGLPATFAQTISVAPDPVAFPDTLIGNTSSAVTITISNTDTTDLDVTSFFLTGVNEFDFNLTPPASLPLTLAQFETATFTVSFSPTGPGTRTAIVEISSNDPANPTTSVDLSGVGIGPNIALSSVSKNFGNVLVGDASAPQSVTISNVGNGDLNVSSVSLTGTDAGQFSLSGFSSGTISPPPSGGSETVSITFSPTSTGAKTAILEITSDDPDTSTVEVTLAGTGVQGQMAVSPGTVNFPDTVPGNDSPVTITVSNGGTADLTYSVAISGVDASYFTTTGSASPATIVPTGSDSFSVTFSPFAVGARSASLDISSSDPDNPTVSISLSGTGVKPDVLVSSTAPIDFGDVPVGSDSLPATITISNGNTPYTSSLTVDLSLTGADAGQFYVTGVAGATVLNPGQSVIISIYYAPSAEGVAAATLNILSDDQETPFITIDLAGTGTVTPSTDDDTESAEEGCFIASVTGDSPLVFTYPALREFRDEILMATGLGRKGVHFYYHYSPQAAEFMADHPPLREASKWVLAPIMLGFAYPSWASGLILLSGIVLVAAFRRRK